MTASVFGQSATDEHRSAPSLAVNTSVTLGEKASLSPAPAKQGSPQSSPLSQPPQPAKAGASQESSAAQPLALPARNAGRQRRMLQDGSSRSALALPPVPWYRTGLGALTIVLGVMAVLWVGVRRWLPTARPSDNRTLRVLARTSLSPKHHLALVQVGRRLVVVGMSGDRLSTLTEIADAEESAALVAQATGSANSHDASFDTLLLHEESQYDDVESSVPPAGEGRPQERRLPRGSNPAAALLRKLQRLQARSL